MGQLPDPAQVEIREATDQDVSGHTASATSVSVTVRFPGGDDDDVEGHALSLRFPDMQAAREFEKRMLATGALVAVFAVGAVGAVGVASQGTSNSVAGPQAAPAPAQYAPAVRDRDRDLNIPQYAPTIRDTDRDLNIPAAPAAPAEEEQQSGDRRL